MAEYRKRPVVVEAFRWTACPLQPDDPEWIIAAIVAGSVTFTRNGQIPVMRIQTLEGPMTALPGDWVIRGVEGELYPCKGSVFRATYDEVVDGAGAAAVGAKDSGLRYRGTKLFYGDHHVSAAPGDFSGFIGFEPMPPEEAAERAQAGRAQNAPKEEPKHPTKWHVHVYLGLGQAWPRVSLTFSEEAAADNALGIVQKRMQDLNTDRFLFTFRHDNGVASFFAADVRVVQKQEFTDYSGGEDF